MAGAVLQGRGGVFFSRFCGCFEQGKVRPDPDIRVTRDDFPQQPVVKGIGKGKHGKGMDKALFDAMDNSLGDAGVKAEIVGVDEQVGWKIV